MDIMLTYSLLNNTVYASVIYSQHTKELKSSGLEMIDDALPANRVPLDKNYTPAQEAKVDSLFSVLKQKIPLPSQFPQKNLQVHRILLKFVPDFFSNQGVGKCRQKDSHHEIQGE